MKFLIFVLIFLIAPTYASEIISQHNEQHVAEQAARNYLKSNGCAWTETKRGERFRLVEHQSSVIIFGNQLHVECVERTALISWDAPASTETIRGYEIYNNDKLLAQADESARKIEIPLPLGSYNFHVKSVDAEGQRSAPSNEAPLTLVNR